MRQLTEQDDFDTLKAVIYDISQYGEADPIFLQNLKREYDGVIGRQLLIQAIEDVGFKLDYKDVMVELMDNGFRIT